MRLDILRDLGMLLMVAQILWAKGRSPAALIHFSKIQSRDPTAVIQWAAALKAML